MIIVRHFHEIEMDVCDPCITVTAVIFSFVCTSVQYIAIETIIVGYNARCVVALAVLLLL